MTTKKVIAHRGLRKLGHLSDEAGDCIKSSSGGKWYYPYDKARVIKLRFITRGVIHHTYEINKTKSEVPLTTMFAELFSAFIPTVCIALFSRYAYGYLFCEIACRKESMTIIIQVHSYYM